MREFPISSAQNCRHKRQKIAISLLLCGALLFSGCAQAGEFWKNAGKKLQDTASKLLEPVITAPAPAPAQITPAPPVAPPAVAVPDGFQMVFFSMGAQQQPVLCENGFINIDTPQPSTGANHLMFLDFDTMRQRYLCTKAGCVHENSACISYIPANENVCVYRWNDMLYLHYSGYQPRKGEENKITYSRVEQRNLDGTGAKIVLTQQDFYSMIPNFVATDGKALYFGVIGYGVTRFDLITKTVQQINETQESFGWLNALQDDAVLLTKWADEKLQLGAISLTTGEYKPLHTWQTNEMQQLYVQPNGKVYGMNIKTGELMCYDVKTDTETVVTNVFAEYCYTVNEASEPYTVCTVTDIVQIGDWLTVNGNRVGRRMAYNLQTHETVDLTLNDYTSGAIFPITLWQETPYGLLVTEESRARVTSVPNYMGAPESNVGSYSVYALLDFEDFIASRPNYRSFLPVHYEGGQVGS